MKTKNQNYFSIKTLASFALILITFFLSTCTKDSTHNNTQNPPPDSTGQKPVVNFNGSLNTTTTGFTPYELSSGGTGTLQPSFDLTQYMPPIRDQNPQGSCVAFALSYLKSFEEKVQYNYDYTNNGIVDYSKIMSPAFIYNQRPYKINCETDGMDVPSALQFLKDYGDCTEQEFSYDKNNCTNQPNDVIKKDALKNKIKAITEIYFTESDALDKMKSAISQMQPVVCDIRVDAEFTNFLPTFSWGNNTWKANNSGDPFNSNYIRGPAYHCILAIGYDDNKSAFKIINSWGTGWQDNGYCWIDYDWFKTRIRRAYVPEDDLTDYSSNPLTYSGDLNFGDVSVNTPATKTLTLTNNSATPISVSNVSIDAPYSIDKTNFTIAANGNTPLKVTFTPTTAGEADKTLTITSDASNSPTTISATGNGTQQQTQTRIISLSSTSLSFGNINIGQPSAQALTITNTGNATLTVNKINYSSSDFTGDWSNGTITAGTSHTVNVTFKPSTAKTYSETLSIDCDATSGTKTVSLSGTGVQVQQPTKIVALSGNLSFGDVIVGQAQSSTLTISNQGNTPLSVSSINTPSGFTENANYPIVVQAGSSQNVTIKFSPTSVQSYSGDITVYSDASNSPTSTPVTGNGISSGGSYTTVPPVGQYQDCDVSGSYYCTPTLSYTSGVIKARIVSVNRSTGDIVIEVEKCSGTTFNYEGELTVNPQLCNSNGVSYGYVVFAAGAPSVQIPIKESDMTGTKTYYPKILQTSGDFATQPLTITFQ